MTLPTDAMMMSSAPYELLCLFREGGRCRKKAGIFSSYRELRPLGAAWASHRPPGGRSPVLSGHIFMVMATLLLARLGRAGEATGLGMSPLGLGSREPLTVGDV